MKISNCPQLISEFGYEAVSRDNICKTQCSFVLNALDPNGGGQRPSLNFFIESDTLQAPGFFDDLSLLDGVTLEPLDNLNSPVNNSPVTSTVIPQQNNGRPFRPTTALGGLGRPGGPPIPPGAPPLPPAPPRAPRPPAVPNAAQISNIAPPPPPGSPATPNGAQNVNPTRNPRPLFNFIPRLPNFSELFGI